MDEPTIIESDDLDAFENLLNNKTPVEDKPPEAQPADDTTEVEDVPEDQTTEEDDAPDGEDKPQPKKDKSRFQEKIDKLTARAREAEREAEAARRKLAELEAAKEKPTEQPATKASGEPDPDAKNPDGTDKYPLGELDKAYLRDLARYYTQEEQAAAKEKARIEAEQQAVEAARNHLQAQWEQRLAPVTEEIPDFIEKTMELEDTFEGLDPDYSDYLVQTIKSLENGPQVLYYFANNIEEAQKFVKLGALSATLALGKYDAMFSKQNKAKTEPRTTKAPPPPPVTNKGAAKVKTDWETDDLDDFYRKLNAAKKK